ncbi:TolC family protein [Labilibaculum antarcticum]|uniref:Transporter n=1 Tax=Labilibaculum antarcticum TaxID=1717717 RepID=A0A1Y1CQG8_9BACT|nr:TolC family protein [Labilibaculum antarcticum]BAX82686.1 transporter [Labilibaculum antarcticum]
MRYSILLITALLVFSETVRSQTITKELQDYINFAIANNPELKVMDLKYQQALEIVPQAKALPDPSFSAGVFIQPIETRIGAQKAKLSLSQMFPWFGTLGAKEQQASLQAHAQYLNYLDAKSKLEMNVRLSYLDLILMDRKIFFTQKRVEVLSLLEKQSLSQFENNQSSMVNVLYVQMLKEELISKLGLFQDKKQTLQSTFNKLLNRNLITAVDLPTDDSFLAQAISFDTDFSFDNHTRIDSWETMKEASSFGEKVAKLNGMPKFGIGLDYAIIAERTDMDVANNGNDALMPMITMSIPLFRKKYKSAVKVNQLKQVQFEQLKIEELNRLELEKQKATEEYATGTREIKVYENLLAKARQSFEILTSNYETSSGKYEEVLNMQQKIWIYEQKQIEAQVMIQKSIAKFQYLGM